MTVARDNKMYQDIARWVYQDTEQCLFSRLVKALSILLVQYGRLKTTSDMTSSNYNKSLDNAKRPCGCMCCAYIRKVHCAVVRI